jgi:hypothetical protein
VDLCNDDSDSDSDDDAEFTEKRVCCICTMDFNVPITAEQTGPLCCANGHSVCPDCLDGTLTDAVNKIRHSVNNNLSTDGIKCSCCDEILPLHIVGLVDPGRLPQLMAAFVEFGENRNARQAAVAAQQALHHPLQNHITLANKLLHTYCPSCTVEWNDFVGCSALTCGYCGSHFCAHCSLVIQDDDELHHHVKHECAENPTPGLLHTPTPVFKKRRIEKMTAAAIQYIEVSVPLPMRDNVREGIQVRVTELELELELANE